MTMTCQHLESMYQIYVHSLDKRNTLLVLASVPEEMMTHLRMDNQDGNLVADLNLVEPYHPKTTVLFDQIKIIGTVTKGSEIFLDKSLMDLVRFMKIPNQRTKTVFILI